MEDYQERVTRERADLEAKIIKLTQFLDSDIKIGNREETLLKEQRHFMLRYLHILNERIMLF